VATWAYASVVPDQVLASSNTATFALAIIFVAAVLFPITADLNLVAKRAVTIVGGCWPYQVYALALWSTSMLLTIINISALLIGRGGAQLTARKALNSVCRWGVMLAPSGKAWQALVNRLLFIVQVATLGLQS